MKRKIQVVLGIVLGALIIWWLFRDTEWTKVYTAIRQSDLRWLFVAEVLVLLTFVLRVQRWVYIVRSAQPVRWGALFSSTQIGFLANFTLPGRVGEIIRAIVLARLAHIPFSKCFAFVALDRVTDLFGLVAMMLVAAVAFRPEGDLVLPPEILATPIPADAIRTSAVVTTVAMIGIITAFVVLYLNKRLVLRIHDAVVGLVSRKLAQKTHEMLDHFAEGMHVFRNGRDMGLAIFFSLLTWLVGAAHYGALLYAFHLDPPWYAPFVVMALLAIAISLPGPPGFIGPFHIGIIGSVLLTMPATDIDTARAAAIFAHLMNLASVAVVGVWCLYREQFGLLELRRETTHTEGLEGEQRASLDAGATPSVEEGHG